MSGLLCARIFLGSQECIFWVLPFCDFLECPKLGDNSVEDWEEKPGSWMALAKDF